MQKKKIGLKKYFSKYWLAISIYILATLISGIVSILMTILFADTVELITQTDFAGAIHLLYWGLALTIVRRLGWITSGYLYNNYSVKIMSNLNADLSKQAFKLNSRTYTSHDTGTFVQRIVNDPERVVDNFASIVDMFADIITSLAMVIYIAHGFPRAQIIYFLF